MHHSRAGRGACRDSLQSWAIHAHILPMHLSFAATNLERLISQARALDYVFSKRALRVQIVRRKRLVSLRNALKGSLPTLPVFVTALGGLAPKIQAMQDIPSLSTATAPSISIQNFMDLQNATWEQKTRPALQSISENVREVRACDGNCFPTSVLHASPAESQLE